MSQQPPSEDGIDTTDTVPRRRILAAGAGIGISLLAGCSSGTDTEDGTTGTEPTEEPTTESESTGDFELLISDQPADIGDFDRLSVTFDSARIFRQGAEPTTESNGTTPEPTTESDGPTPEPTTTSGTTTAGTTETPTQTETAEDGFTVLDLEDPTVDLTTVLGEDAVSVFAGELPAGTYTKVELNVAEVEGIVDGESVPVKVPSEKLQIVHNFTVGEEPVQFVFDINVIKKGPNGYNLLPVISESGVAGKDVPVNVIERQQAATSRDRTSQPTTGTTAE